jgi:hypothetical protein
MLCAAMTILSRSLRDPQLLTAQCDYCWPPLVVTNQEPDLLEIGWRFAHLGHHADECHQCRRNRWHERTRVERAREVAEPAGHLPNFFIIGAAKAGTTSLHNYLAGHPDIAMAPWKELTFFQDPAYMEWLPLYRQQFPTDSAIRGESSTHYTRTPALPGVAGRMASLVPDARLVYLVRDPVERAIASYREERFHVNDRRTIAAAFSDLADPFNPYVAASRYADQLSEYLKHFPREQILVLEMTALRDDREATLRRVLDFLGVDAEAELETSVEHNRAEGKLEYNRFGHWLRYSRVANAMRRSLPAATRQSLVAPARRFLRKPIEVDLPEDLHDRLREALAPDAKRFREMTGMAFADWSL